MAQSAQVPPIVNSAMKFVLRSPLHGMVSKSILLITFTGRKTGKAYTTPVSYSQNGETVLIFTHAAWWKNLIGGAQVTLRLRGRDTRGIAEPVRDTQAIADALMAHLPHARQDAGYMGVTFDEQGQPRAAEVAKAAESLVMVRVQLC